MAMNDHDVRMGVLVLGQEYTEGARVRLPSGIIVTAKALPRCLRQPPQVTLTPRSTSCPGPAAASSSARLGEMSNPAKWRLIDKDEKSDMAGARRLPATPLTRKGVRTAPRMGSEAATERPNHKRKCDGPDDGQLAEQLASGNSAAGGGTGGEAGGQQPMTVECNKQPAEALAETLARQLVDEREKTADHMAGAEEWARHSFGSWRRHRRRLRRSTSTG